ncbi:MAG: hypothetical protein O7F71_17365, partial [Gammaproteobacteria bacterium]|nr:hypothetical protein [Gammaproteobacteria bacterium]
LVFWAGASVWCMDAPPFPKEMRGLRSKPTEENSQDANFRTRTAHARLLLDFPENQPIQLAL